MDGNGMGSETQGGIIGREKSDGGKTSAGGATKELDEEASEMLG